MVRLAISVEGQTEEMFINKVIVPYLKKLEIYAHPILLGKTGGDVNLSSIKKDLNTLANSFDKVTTLYDFYGFRGKEENETKETLEQKIIDSVAVLLRPRIIPYVQMYEFEGLLFSSPASMANNLCDPSLEAWAEGVLQKFENNPESINDSPQTAPSKRLANKNCKRGALFVQYKHQTDTYWICPLIHRQAGPVCAKAGAFGTGCARKPYLHRPWPDRH